MTGLGAGEIKKIGQLYRRKVPPERVVTHELARVLTSLSREINRQIGILISRRGEIAYVIVGSHKEIMIPSLDGFRSSSGPGLAPPRSCLCRGDAGGRPSRVCPHGPPASGESGR